MTENGRRWARALALAAIAALLYQVEIPYQARYFGGGEHVASLVHLHTGFLLALAMLCSDRIVLPLAVLANLGVWLLRVDQQSGLDPALATYGVAAMAMTFVLLRAAAQAMGWPRSGRRRQFRLADTPRFAVVAIVLLPVALAATIYGLEVAMAAWTGVPRDALNPAVQVLFAKFFGIVILTLPLVLASSRHAAPDESGEGYIGVSLPVLLLGVALPVLALLAARGEVTGLAGWLATAGDHRLFLAAALVAAVLLLDARWSMAVVVLAMLLFTTGLTRQADAAAEVTGLLDLGQVALEAMLLVALALLVFLFNRDRDAALARRERDSRSDPLSGLPNLTALRARTDLPVGTELGFLVLDRTDKVSAGLGLRAEAKLMRAVAEHLRGYADAFHIGSGQFALLMTGTDTGAPWLINWDDVLARLHAFSFEWQGDRIKVLPYLGVAAIGEGGERVDELIVRAANAAFDARQSGEPRAQAAERSGDTDPAGLRRAALQLSSNVLSQLRADQVELYWQPVHPLRPHLASGRASGEILCRLRDESGRLMLPGQFLAELYADRRLVELDLAVLRSLSRWLSLHPDLVPGIGRISVNIAGQSLLATGFERDLLAVLDRFPIPLSSVCLELTETAAFGHSRRTVGLFQKVRNLGCHIAIDDFGVGFQSFERLKQIPVDVIKIDGSFIQAMGRSTRDLALVQASVDIARAFGAETVAEYVDDAATVDTLRRLGVDWGQGHWFGHPVPIGEALAAGMVAPVADDAKVIGFPGGRERP